MIAALAMLLAGCAAEGAGARDVELGAEEGTLAAIRVERRADADPSVALPGAVVSAAFAAHHGVPEASVAALVGVAIEPAFGCALVSPGLALSAPGARIELVDVGPLELRVAGTRAAAHPRTFPELAGVVAGVFYAEDTDLGAARAEVDEVVVSARGSDAFAGFEVVAVAPPALEGLAFAGPSALTWNAGDPDDLVEIELSVASQILHCIAVDDGALEIPDALFGALRDGGAHAVARRVRRVPFDAAGFDEAWLALVTSSDQPLSRP